jgi:hypothetical protein
MARRSYSRVPASHPILYYRDVRPRPKVAETLDLSLEGAAIETRHPLTRGESIEISIAIGSHLIKCRGRVIYTLSLKGKRLRAGIRFEDLSKQDGLYLREYFHIMKQGD